jgi:shikimate kinase
MLKNLVLIGFMGSGKSSIGRELAKSLSFPVLDTDALLVERAGKAIKDIFADEGEEAFRDMESRILEDLVAQKPEKHIISTGGGIIGRAENRRLLRELGYVIWLLVSPEEIRRRTARNNDRPLLVNAQPEETIKKLLTARTPLYEETAHLTIETDNLTFPEISTGIIESARYHFGTP